MNEPAQVAEATPRDPDRPMSRGQKLIAAAILLAIVALGVTTEQRSVFLKRRMTDLGPYLRAAWAIRVGADPYAVTDHNDWHYCYPQLLAIALGPLAEAPPGGEQVFALPWAVSVAVWYLIGAACILLATHLCVCAIETEMARPPRRFGFAWWSLRLGPLVLILPMAGRTIARGQVNTIVVAFLAGWITSVIRGRRLTGGFCLAMAVCIKIIPAFLFLHPLWRRDGRALSGVALGLFVGLVVAPIIASGPVAAAEQSRSLVETVLLPGVGAGTDTSRAEELTGATSTDSQSIQSVIHILRHRHPWFRPKTLDQSTSIAHWSAALVLTALTLWVLGRRPKTPRNELAFAGSLCLIMALISPVCHLHYFVFALPLVTALWCRPRTRLTTAVVLAFLFVHTLSIFPLHFGNMWEFPIRQFGFTTATALGLWLVAIIQRGPNVAMDQARLLAPSPARAA